MANHLWLTMTSLLCLFKLVWSESPKFHSKPIAHDSHYPEHKEFHKFKQRQTVKTSDIVFGKDASHFKNAHPCYHPIDVSWSAEVGSSVYATPVIADLFGDGKKEIILPTFTNYIEVLDGETGETSAGWPYMHHKIGSHASVVVHDINQDGQNDIMYSTQNAELLFFSAMGEPYIDRGMKIPPLKVPTRWYQTAGKTDDINEKFYEEVQEERRHHHEEKYVQDHPESAKPWAEHHSLEEDTLREKMAASGRKEKEARRKMAGSSGGLDSALTDLLKKASDGKDKQGIPVTADGKGDKKGAPMTEPIIQGAGRKLMAVHRRRRKAKVVNSEEETENGNSEQEENSEAEAKDSEAEEHSEAEAKEHSEAEDHSEPEEGSEKQNSDPEDDHQEDLEDQWDEEIGSEDLVDLDDEDDEDDDDEDDDDEDWDDSMFKGNASGIGPQVAFSDEARASLGLIFGQVANSDSHYKQSSIGDPLHEWFGPNEYKYTEDFIWVDAHILATPKIVDIDGDNHDDVIVPVTYFFEASDYWEPKKRAAHGIPADLDLENYVAGGIVVMDLASGQVKWAKQMDLTTNKVKYRAYIYSSPTVVDLDGDGQLEIIVTTGEGFIYVFQPNGNLRTGFPKFMAEIQGQASVADIDGDGYVDICVADFKSNLACFDKDGKDIWDRQLSGSAAQMISFGDINGDGQLDIVSVSNTGHIWAMNAKTGDTLPNFPIKTGGPIYSPPLLVNLNETKGRPLMLHELQALEMPGHQTAHVYEVIAGSPVGLHIVVPSHDGHVYIIDGITTCVDKIDLGEKTYSMVLADDIDSNGMLDLVVTTMNGNVYTLNTATKMHPLKAWTSETHGLNGFTALEGYIGVFISPQSRVQRDVVGDHFKIMFEIVDRRKQHMQRSKSLRKYHVKITVGQGVVILSKTYFRATKYVEIVRTPLMRMHCTLYITMTNEHHQEYADSMPISFNMEYYVTIKWLLFLPFCLIAVALALNKATNQYLTPNMDDFDLHGEYGEDPYGLRDPRDAELEEYMVKRMYAHYEAQSQAQAQAAQAQAAQAQAAQAQPRQEYAYPQGGGVSDPQQYMQQDYHSAHSGKQN